MSGNNSPKTVIQAFAEQHGIADLTWGTSGTAALCLPDGVELYLEEVRTNGKLFVYLECGDLPLGEDRSDYLEKMLTLNCLEQGTSCGTFAVDGLTNTVLLQTGISLIDLSVSRLEQAMEGLLQHRSRLITILSSRKSGNHTQKKSMRPSAMQISRWQTTGKQL